MQEGRWGKPQQDRYRLSPKKCPAEIISSSSGNGLTENSSTLYRSGAILNFRTNMVNSNLIPCLCETLETNFIRHQAFLPRYTGYGILSKKLISHWILLCTVCTTQVQLCNCLSRFCSCYIELVIVMCRHSVTSSYYITMQ